MHPSAGNKTTNVLQQLIYNNVIIKNIVIDFIAKQIKCYYSEISLMER